PRGVRWGHDHDPVVSVPLAVITGPTLVKVEGGTEVARLEGWERSKWEELTGVAGLGPDLPDWRPGCGSRTVEWAVAEELAVRHDAPSLRSRRIEAGQLEDDVELCFDRGWTDGLPVVPPTEARVLRMLTGTTRSPDEV